METSFAEDTLGLPRRKSRPPSWLVPVLASLIYACNVVPAAAGIGLWGNNGVAVSTSGAVQSGSNENVAIASDTAGGLYVVWVDTGGFSVPAAGQGNLYAIHYDKNGVLASGWPTANGGVVLLSNNVSTSTNLQGKAMVAASDEAGGIVVYWTPDDITKFFQRVASNGQAHAGWSTGAGTSAGIGGGVTYTTSSFSETVVSGDGIFLIQPGPAGELYINALNLSNGAQHSGFTGLGVQILDSTVGPTIIGGGMSASPAGSGQANAGVILAGNAKWNGANSGNDVQVVRVDTSGTKRWQVAVTNTGTVSASPNGETALPISDGSGGAYIVWVDTRSAGAGPGIYTAYYNGAGTSVWTGANGARIAPLTGSTVNSVKTAAAQTSGYVVVWSTGGGGSGDMYGQIVKNNGASASALLNDTDLVSNGNSRSFTAAALLPGGNPLYLVAYTPSGVNAAPVVRTFDGSGTPVLTDAPAVTGNPVSASMKQALGAGDRFALVFNTDQNCSGSQCSANLYAQAVSTFVVVSAPTNVSVSAQSAYSVQASWNDSNSPGASDFLVQAALDSGFTLVAAQTLVSSSGTGNSYTFLGLLPATNYYVRVRARIGGAPSAFTAASNNPVTTAASGVSLSNPSFNWSGVQITNTATRSGPNCANPNSGGGCGQRTLLVPGPGGDTYLIWTQDDGTGLAYNVLAQRLRYSTGLAVWSSTLTVVSRVPVGGGDNSGRADAVGASPDGSGGFIVAWGSGTTVNRGLAMRVNADQSLAWTGGPKPFTDPNSLGFVETPAVGSTKVFFVAAGPLVVNAAEVYVQALNLTDGAAAFTANGGKGVDTNFSVGAGEAVIDGARSPAGGGLAEGMILFLGSAGAGSSVKAMRIDVNGTVNWTSSPYPQLTNVSGEKVAVIEDGASGAYFLWVDTITPAVKAMRVQVDGVAVANFPVTLAGDSANGLRAVLTSAGAVAAWAAPSGPNSIVKAGLVNPAGTSPSWTQSVATVSGSVNDVAVASNTLSEVAVAYGYNVSSLNRLDVAELAIGDGSFKVGPANVLANMPSPGGSNTSALAAGTTTNFIVAAAYPPNVFAQQVSTFTVLLAPTSLNVTNATTNSLSFAWTDANTPPATSFLAEVSSFSNFSGFLSSNTVLSSASFAGLNPNTTYFLRVQASSAGVNSPFSSSLTTSTFAVPPAMVTVTAVSSFSVSAAWSLENGPGARYQLRIATASNFSGNVTTSAFQTATSYTFPGLSPYTTYFIAVRAQGNNGDITAFDTPASTQTLPGDLSAPTNVSGSAQSAYSVQVTWNDSNNPGASDFLVQAALDSGFTLVAAQTLVSGGAGNTYTFNGLSPATNYYVRVRARIGGAPSAFTAASNNPVTTAASGVSLSNPSFNWSGVQITNTATRSGPNCADTNIEGGCGQRTLLVPGPGGDTYLIWTQDDGTGLAYNVLAQRLRYSTGLAVWSSTLTVVSRVPVGGGDNSGRADAVGAAPDGSGGFIVAWGSGTTVNRGWAMRVNADQSLAWTGGPKPFTDPNSLGFVETPAVGSTKVFFVAAGPLVVNAAEVYVQALNLTDGAAAFTANGGKGVDTNFSVGAGEAVIDGARSPAGGGLAEGMILFLGSAGAGSSVKATRIDVNGTVNWTSNPYPQLTNVAKVTVIEDGASGAYFLWVDTITPAVKAMRVQVDGVAVANFPVTLAGDSANGLRAVLTSAGAVAAWAKPDGPNSIVKAGLVNPAGTSPSWTQSVATVSGSVNDVAVASNTLSEVAVAYGYNVSGLNSLDVAELAIGDGSFKVGPANVLANMPSPGGSNTSALAAGTTTNFIVGAAYPPNVFAQQVSTFSVLLAPTSLNVTGGTTNSLSLAWTDANTSPATSFLAEVSSFSNFSGFLSSNTVLSSASFAGLNPNTTYFLRVQASSAGVNSPFSSSLTTSTFANAPVSLVQIAASSFSLTVTWDANGDPVPGTRFEAAVSGVADFSTGVTTVTTTTPSSTTIAGLLPDTAYYIRVRAIGNNGDLTAFATLYEAVNGGTVTGPPPLASPTFTAVGTNTATVQWQAPGVSGPEYRYTAEAYSDANFSSLVASSVTYNTQATFGAGGGGTLAANTTYFFRVKSQDVLGPGAVFFTAYTVLGGTSTLAVPPATVTVTAVSSFSVSAAWSSTDNGPVAKYQAAVSTAPDFSGVVTTSAFQTATSYSLLGLSPYTTYFLAVRAQGNNGDITAFSSPASTRTLVDPFAPVSAPTNVSGSAQSAYSVQVTWNDSNNPGASDFLVQAALDSGFTLVAAQTLVSGGAGNTYTFNGLSPATNYYLRVRARRGGAPSAFTAASNNPVTTTASGVSIANPSFGNWSGVQITNTATRSGPNCASNNSDSGCGQRTLLVPGPGGDTYLIWTQDDGTGLAYNVLAQRLRYSTGLAVWSSTLTVVSRVPVGGGDNSGSADAVGASPDGSGGFIVSWGSGTTVNRGWAMRVNADQSLAWTGGPKPFTDPNSLGFGETPAVGSTKVFFVAAGPLVVNAAEVYVQALNLSDGAVAFTANGGKGIDTNFSVGEADNVIEGVRSPAGGGLAEGMILFFGTAGAGSSVKATRIDVNGTVNWTSNPYPQLTNVGGEKSTAIEDGASGAYFLWVDTITPAVKAMRIQVDGVAVANFPVTLAGDSANDLGAVLTSAGAVAAWAAPSGPNTIVKAGLVNPAGTSPSWTQSVATVSGSVNDVAVASNTLSEVAVAYGYNVSSLNRLDVAELAIGDGSVKVGPANVLANMPSPGGSNTSALAAGTTTNFIVAAAHPPNVFAQQVSTFTVLLAPTSLNVTGGTTNSLSLAWTDANPSPATIYTAQLSSFSNFSASFSSTTANTNAVFGAGGIGSLNPNTTYFLRVQASSAGVNSPFSSSLTTSTFANAPVSLTQIAASSFSLTVTWDANGDPVPGTRFEAAVSGVADFSTGVTTVTTTNTTTATISGLLPDTAYYIRVRAIGNNGDLTAFATLYEAVNGGTVTGPPPLASPTFTAVGTNTATVQWQAPGVSGPEYRYTAEAYSDANFSSLVASSVTYNTQATFGAGGGGTLAANTTYFFRVKSQDVLGPGAVFFTAYTVLGGTSTLAVAPSLVSFVAVSSFSATAAWSQDNGPVAKFQAAISTSPAFSAPVTTAPFQTTTSYVFPGLSPSTTYYLHVLAMGNNGDFAVSGSTAARTLVGPPGTFSPAFTGVTTGGLTANWTSGGNGGTLRYQADISSDSLFVNVLASSVTLNTTAAFASLSANTTYFARVKVLDNGSGGSSGFIQLGSTSTFAAPPATVSFVAVSSFGATAAWSSTDNGPVAKYQAAVSSAPDFSGAVTTSPFSSATSFVLTGLSSNTTYYAHVRAQGNNGDITAFSASASTITLLGPPGATSPAFTSVAATGLTANWTNGGNGGTLKYQADVSTDLVLFSNALSSVTYNPFAAFTGLSPNTTYFARVKIVDDGSGRSSGFIQLGSTSTLAVPPSTVTVTAVSSFSVSAAWSLTDNGPVAKYQAAVSSAPDFSGVVSTSPFSSATSFLVTGLSANTTYYAHVRSQGNNGDITAFSASASTITLLGPPGAASPAFTSVAATGLTANWTNGGNGGTLKYQADVSTDSVLFSNALSSVTYNPFAAFTGLSPNTTYFARVKIVDDGSGRSSGFIQAGSTSTLAVPPSTVTATAVSSSSVIANWLNNNGPIAKYQARISTASDFSGSVTTSPFQAATTYAFTGLSPHTTYYAAVRAQGNNSDLSGYSNPAAARTFPTVPGLTAPAFTSVTTSGLTANWTSGGNGGTPRYEAHVSTDSGFGVFASSLTYSLSAAFGSLSPNTTYFARVRSVDDGSGAASGFLLLSTSTLAVPPATVTVTAVSSFSVSATWSSTDNGPVARYQVRIATASNFSGNVTTSAFQTAASTTFLGLSPNTTYFIAARAQGNNGDITAFDSPASTQTLPGPPALASPAFTNVAATGLTANWTSGGNGGTPRYEAVVSTDSGFGVLASSLTYNLSADFAGLSVNATYYLRVRIADNGSGIASVFTPSASTSTLANAPSGTAVVSVSSASANLTWGLNGNPAGTPFRVWRDNTAGFSSPVIAGVAITSFVATGLSAGSTYFFKVQGVNNLGVATAFDSTVTTVTLPAPPANAPGGLLGTALGVASITWTWNAVSSATGYNFYPSTGGAAIALAGTTLTQVGLSTDTAYGARVAGTNESGAGPLSAAVTAYTLATPPTASSVTAIFVSSVALTWGSATNPASTRYQVEYWTVGGTTTSVTVSTTNASVTGLLSGTPYFFQVKAKNGDGLLTAPNAQVSALTLVAAPVNIAGTALGVSSITWTWSATTGATGYNFYPSTGGPPIALTALSLLQVGLTTNTAYGARLTATNATGEGQQSSLVTVFTLAAPPTSFAVTDVGITTMTLTWNANTNPAGNTSYQVNYTAVGGTTKNVSVSTTNATLTGLAGGTTYTLQVGAKNGNGLLTLYDVLLTTVTLPVVAVEQSVGAGGGTLLFIPPDGPVTVSIPAGAFATPTLVTVGLPDSPLAAPTAPTLRLVGTGIAITITLDKQVQPAQPVTVTITYTAASAAGLDENTLVIARYDTTQGVWVPLPSTPDPLTRTVRAVTDHFSTFQVMAASPSSSVSTVKVFPNPFRPAKGHTVMSFTDLPSGATLKIYTLAGEKVRELLTNASGIATWDCRNGAGANVGSGVYFVRLDGGGSKVIKIAVQR